MRAIPFELRAKLDAGTTTLCRCWRLTFRDGTVMGFTDHDETLGFDGVTYRAESGLDARSLQTGTGLSVDNGQAVGALSSDAITESDIRAGRYDRARVDQWLVDWKQPDLRVQIFRGTIGEIRLSDAGFEAELRGMAEDLNVPVGRSIFRTCDRVLGDSKCGFDLTSPGFSAETAAQAGSARGRVIAFRLEDFADGWFAQGTLTWLDGANSGSTFRIKEDRPYNITRLIELWEEPSELISTGDRFRVTAGCDKRAVTCREKFSNFRNFRGFPHIPGEDWVVAYPKDGAVHDGQSRERN